MQHIGNVVPHSWALDGYYAVLVRQGTAMPTSRRSSSRCRVRLGFACSDSGDSGSSARPAPAMCDAQHIGSIDGAPPERAHQDVPPSVVRLVGVVTAGGTGFPVVARPEG